ncbi:uncharacterized protein LOC130726356 [Lotus japonicus]|uniref:uncharacterized protein LOC130726356 n=1 Tax=Lotus japonicus TaxID=34305 RepID=UPI0025854655|nr:uncharacterized protein LOC130726356 [Lotus japonicus]
MGHHNNGGSWPPIGAPLNVRADQLQHWTSNFDSTVNAVSFGFVATAILISMFLVMAIFERFLRPPPPPPSGRRSRRAVESQVALGGKLGHSSPKMNGYGSWVSVLMPGEETPSFIAHPAPAPCSPERISWPSHHQNKTLPCSTSNIIPPNIDQV